MDDRRLLNTELFDPAVAVERIAAEFRAGFEAIEKIDRPAVTTFGSFKNLGLTVVLAFAIFGQTATLPSIVSLVFEILWLGALPFVFRSQDSTPHLAST